MTDRRLRQLCRAATTDPDAVAPWLRECMRRGYGEVADTLAETGHEAAVHLLPQCPARVYQLDHDTNVWVDKLFHAMHPLRLHPDPTTRLQVMAVHLATVAYALAVEGRDTRHYQHCYDCSQDRHCAETAILHQQVVAAQSYLEAPTRDSAQILVLAGTTARDRVGAGIWGAWSSVPASVHEGGMQLADAISACSLVAWTTPYAVPSWEERLNSEHDGHLKIKRACELRVQQLALDKLRKESA